jgi:polyisoprenyl-phosphate glycosyltransferase
MPQKQVRTSVVLAMRNEAPLVNELLTRIEAALSSLEGGFEVVAVDDGSSDDTWARLKEAAPSRPWLRGLRFARSFGQHPATLAGLASAAGETIVGMDADLQVSPEDIPLLLSRVDGGADVAFGAREHAGEGFLRQVVGPAVHGFLNRHAVGHPPNAISTFFAARRSVVERALLFSVARPVAPFHLMLGGPRRVDAVAVRNAPRPRGESKYNAARLLRLSGDIFFGYTDLAWPAIAAFSLAVPGAAAGFWLPAVLLALAGWERMSLVFLMAGALAVPVALAGLLSVVAELALRVRPASTPLYVVSEIF